MFDEDKIISEKKVKFILIELKKTTTILDHEFSFNTVSEFKGGGQRRRHEGRRKNLESNTLRFTNMTRLVSRMKLLHPL